MAATTMLFGPEWMRPKNTARLQNPPSPPPANPPTTSSSYSSLVAPPATGTQEKRNEANPFLYSKDEMLRVYKDGGGRGGLGLEVERWEGVVREVGNEPVALKEWGDAERKLFAGSLNSEVRRRQSSDILSPLSPTSERPKLLSNGSGLASPMRERFNLIARRRDSTDQPPTTAPPRKLSLNAGQGPFGSPRDTGLPSPRTRGPLTPGFDGVLSSGDAWMSRRRASENNLKATSASRSDATDNLDGTGSKIKEEEEPDNSDNSNWRASSQTRESAMSDVSNATETVATGMAGLTGKDDAADAPSDPPTAPPPGPLDVASIEWSYLDPQGQIQGPFRADLMQKWSSQGYFTPDLLVKRTTLDTEWTPVGVLAQSLGGDKLFLTPFNPNAAPPGLTRAQDPPQPDPPQARESSPFRMPYQPIPQHSLHPSTLEAYYGQGSSSNSPSSSFGAARFGNGSPDPSAFGGRLVGHADSPVGSRGGFVPESGFSPSRRQAYDNISDPQLDPSYQRVGYNNLAPVRTPSTDSYGLAAPSYSNQVPWSSTSNGQASLTTIRTSSLDNYNAQFAHVSDSGHTAPSPLSKNPATIPGQDNLGYGVPSQRDFSRVPSSSTHSHIGLANFDLNPGPAAFDASQPYTQSPSLALASPSLPPASTIVPTRVASGPSAHQFGALKQPSASSQVSWTGAEPSVPKRTGITPFDANVFPTSRNTVPIRDPPPAQPMTRWQGQSQVASSATPVDQQSPWFKASQVVVDESWRHVEGPNSLTVSNLGQHDQQQAQDEALAGTPSAPSKGQIDDLTQTKAELETAAPIVEPVQTPSKSKRKSTAPPVPSSPKAPSPSPGTADAASTTPPAQPTAKVVWSTDEDKKRVSSAAMSLREIQEAETKKQEARKAAERERERAVRAAAAAVSLPAEDAQPFVASWGLPTSQAGTIRAKDVPSATSSPAAANPPTPVWTTAIKLPTAKKTMKEIQDEEEKRKAALSKETAAAAARRAYADTTNKTSIMPIVGGAWTTVGSNGKTGTAPTPAAPAPSVRPTITPSSSVTTAIVRKSSTPVVANRAAAPTTAKAMPKADDTPVAPSPEFMKWLSDALKALSNSVNYEDIMSMLLSFPLDEPTTLEIISDLIYAHSTTLDGRRFAQDFVAKRKADVTTRKVASSGGKGPSIADVVKSQPKPTQQSEWGGFKVVNKKKKGGRA